MTVVALAVVGFRSNLGLYDYRMLLRLSPELPGAMSTANSAAMFWMCFVRSRSREVVEKFP